MRNLYLVRHGQVDFPDGVRRCIGATDYSLSETGREQALELGRYFGQSEELLFASGDKGSFAIFCSPLRRALETAELLSAGRWPVYVKEDLRERDMGEWEDIPLKDLKKTLESEPEHGEPREAGQRRFQKAIEEILKETTGDIICVAHAGVNCCFLAGLLGEPLETSRALPQPYGGFSRIEVLEEKEGRVEGKSGQDAPNRRFLMRVAELGRMPRNAPDDKACEAIWEHYHTPREVRKHCLAVAKKADELGFGLKSGGVKLDLSLIHGAALLHDVARREKNHEAAGAKWVRREGYPKAAEIIRLHHDRGKRQAEMPPDEVDVVYLADKLVCGTESVDLEARFERKREQLESAMPPEVLNEALAGWQRRFEEARAVQERVERFLAFDMHRTT